MRSICAIVLAVGSLMAASAPAKAGTDIPFSVTSGGGTINDSFITLFTLTLPGEVDILTSLELDITGLQHSNPADLEFYLINPTIGSITVLRDQGDGIPIGGVNLTFSDSAGGPAPFFTELLSGTYQPLGVTQPPDDNGFATFLGSQGAGMWTLLVIDDSFGDTGSIDSWTLRGTYVPEPVTMSLLAIGALATLRRRRK
jgi:hypothetical protein